MSLRGGFVFALGRVRLVVPLTAGFSVAVCSPRGTGLPEANSDFCGYSWHQSRGEIAFLRLRPISSCLKTHSFFLRLSLIRRVRNGALLYCCKSSRSHFLAFHRWSPLSLGCGSRVNSLTIASSLAFRGVLANVLLQACDACFSSEPILSVSRFRLVSACPVITFQHVSASGNA